jgi:predicted  nucleic acid-binding Zn-ribbon protein
MNNTIQGELNRRNTETMAQKLEEMNQRIYAQNVKIESLQNTVHTFTSKIQALETQLNFMRAKMAGSGPSA